MTEVSECNRSLQVRRVPLRCSMDVTATPTLQPAHCIGCNVRRIAIRAEPTIFRLPIGIYREKGTVRAGRFLRVIDPKRIRGIGRHCHTPNPTTGGTNDELVADCANSYIDGSIPPRTVWRPVPITAECHVLADAAMWLSSRMGTVGGVHGNGCVIESHDE